MPNVNNNAITTSTDVILVSTLFEISCLVLKLTIVDFEHIKFGQDKFDAPVLILTINDFEHIKSGWNQFEMPHIAN